VIEVRTARRSSASSCSVEETKTRTRRSGVLISGALSPGMPGSVAKGE
jgi:hypothetical protein